MQNIFVDENTLYFVLFCFFFLIGTRKIIMILYEAVYTYMLTVWRLYQKKTKAKFQSFPIIC